MSQTKKFIYTLIAAAINGFTVAVILKGAMGIGAWDSLGDTFGHILNIKVGTMCFIFNALCLVGEIIVLGKKFEKRYLLQLVPCLILGSVTNFFFYDVLKFELNNYILRLLFVFVGYTISSFVVAFITLADVVSFPLEAFCNCLSDRFNKSFNFFRQGIDALSIVVSVVLCFLFKIPSTVREGTVIGMLIYSPFMTFFMKKMERFM